MEDPTKYPIGMQDFEKIREEGYIYVDKTAFIRKLVTSGSYYFLSRPRRFGKSLLLSTLAAWFEGKRKLFKGLAIAEHAQKWPKHPVLYLDLSNEKYTEPTVLDAVLNNRLNTWEALYGGREENAAAAYAVDERRDSLRLVPRSAEGGVKLEIHNSTHILFLKIS